MRSRKTGREVSMCDRQRRTYEEKEAERGGLIYPLNAEVKKLKAS